MPTTTAQLMFRRYASSVVLVEVKNSHGDTHNGTGFHAGDGLLVTAAHVVRGGSLRILANERDEHYHEVDAVHVSDSADLAVIECATVATLPSIPMGGHLDDWIDDQAFLLWPCLVLGFPPIPTTIRPALVAFSSEINAVVDRYTTRGAHFIVSGTPRGGFSGGPVLADPAGTGEGFLLGVVTDSPTRGAAEPESGFFACTSIEPVLHLLGKIGRRPADVPDEIWSLFTETEAP